MIVCLRLYCKTIFIVRSIKRNNGLIYLLHLLWFTESTIQKKITLSEDTWAISTAK